MKLSRFIILLTALFLFYLHAGAQTYTVKKIPKGGLQITGRGDHTSWKNANVLTNFSYPWEKEQAPATSFSALWDGSWLYCLFQVHDDSVITLVNKNDKLEVGASDRVEIFLSPDTSLSPYYCLEMDATGRVLDYRASYYRKMDYSWKWPNDQFIIKTAKNKSGYVVEIAISIQSLNDLGLLKNNRLLAGLFRAERKSGREARANLHWISWVKPNAAKPDFHIPSAFGVFILE
ncbi:carbohydrate-binding family 9-like protein [Longitalea luteola]|uniref:carbohydrate-binding family 9-like protein n=1 Tax=Longitalea luteola TaxID=2812563 RepID=UPI001A97A44F|nr:carbohydrate-binding family 9-like protein [Longitalea luteola]